MANINENTVVKGQKRLRCGYTTGTCAAAAAKAAAAMLFSGKICRQVRLRLPGGQEIILEPLIQEMGREYVCCGIVKDAGDDPDITNGLMICARVDKKEQAGVFIDGGEGVGRVTKAGLDQPVGAAAINSVPRRMIEEAVTEVMAAHDYGGGLSVVISIPGGKSRAEKTMNPMLGIEGGLSVLGTTGIVEPMSEQALVDTIAVEIRMHRARKEPILIMAPGNYGLDFMNETYGITSEQIIKISNYIGESIDLAVYEGASGIVLAGHIGKLVKVAGGIMNTHSHQADARLEILTANAAVAGAPAPLLRRMMEAVTTDAALAVLEAGGLLENTMTLITEKIQNHLKRRAGKETEIGVILFSNVYGLLGQTENVPSMMRRYKENCL